MDEKISNLKVILLGKPDPNASPDSYSIYFSYTRQPTPPAPSPFICIRSITLSTLTALIRAQPDSQDVNVVALSVLRPDVCILELDHSPGDVVIFPEELYENSEPCGKETYSSMQFISLIVDEFASDILYRGEFRAFWNGLVDLKLYKYLEKPFIERYASLVDQVCCPYPKAFRKNMPGAFGSPESESEYLQKYQHHFYEPCFKDNFEWLSDMQHYGMPTRFLDVTSNPLSALYFSCDGGFKPYHPSRHRSEGRHDEGNDGAVFLYSMKRKNEATRAPFVLEAFIKNFWCDLASVHDYMAFRNFLARKLKSYVKMYANEFFDKMALSNISRENKMQEIKRWLNQENNDIYLMSSLKSLISEDSIDNFYSMLRNLYYYSPLHVIPPSYLNDRISNQCGSFLIFPGKKFKNHEVMKITSSIIPKVIFIPVEWKRKILKLLRNQFGVHEGSIYPDKEHIVKSILTKY